MATITRLTNWFEKPLITCVKLIGTTPFPSKQSRNTGISYAEPFNFVKYLSSSFKMPVNFVFYEQIKDLPNHPEILLIDVREPDEIQQTGKIPTSINIPLARVQQELGTGMIADDFKKKYGRDKPCESTTIIFHCRSGRRSQEAAEYALSMFYTNVNNYKGSWNEWVEREGLLN